ncbi:hypothetical protein KR51_00022970 [Rubidibacter lacunae KORDI 51-2]|uniref:Hemolysin-type calcium-binding repeat (2 copies) n=1 Tax=Rubidibacter lacunae KORDI 51-2 TaxID=582515 RepID=U5DMW9_9CHRO|nr:hypothetical protein [Rubidibacter lacunae]ERN41040.1 hypothetical protein KR51_00022970 [Rubidibacter lacunae KORDI 51-2]
MLGAAAIPQFNIQEVFIFEGEENQVSQTINQTIFFLGVTPSALESSPLAQFFIQDEFDLGNENQIEQGIEQTAPVIPLFPNRLDSDISDPFSLEVDRFLNADESLDSLQFVSQEADVLGNENEVVQETQQELVIPFAIDLGLANGSNDFLDGGIEDLAATISDSGVLDALQFGIQEILIEGDGNVIRQQIDQILISLIVLDEADIASLSESAGSPTQFAIQETFAGEEAGLANDNAIAQSGTQTIFFEPLGVAGEIETSTGRELNDAELDIDNFIATILGQTQIDSVQTTAQRATPTGNGSQQVQEANQELIVEGPKPLVFGTLANDDIEPGRNLDVNGFGDFVFAGSGADLIDLTGVSPEVERLDFLDIPSNMRLFGGSGDDEIFTNSGDRAFGGSGNDILDASAGSGGNRLYGGDGSDTLIGLNDDRLLGGAGDDRLFVVGTGDNLLTGGPGRDRFWIANAALPTAPSTITDFTVDVDEIGIGGLGIGFSDLSLRQEGENVAIGALGQDLAVLLNSELDALNASAFTFEN